MVTRTGNNMNRAATGRSRFIGVSFHVPARLWRAYITVKGRQVSLGYFHTEEAAARARNAGAIRYYGTSARLNTEGANASQN